MAKININSSLSIEEAFENFIFSKSAQGVTERTLKSYKGHFRCISNYLDTTIQLSDLKKETTFKMITKMREEGLCDVRISNYKTEETVKETYTDHELALLLKKPNIKTTNFCEYRTWVIINFLMNSGARASTVRSILIGDVDLENGLVAYRHNKNHKVQIIPLCSQMRSILSEYLFHREGSDFDYLFCTEEGEQLTENALKLSIIRYNRSRGVRLMSFVPFEPVSFKQASVLI